MKPTGRITDPFHFELDLKVSAKKSRITVGVNSGFQELTPVRGPNHGTARGEEVIYLWPQ